MHDLDFEHEHDDFSEAERSAIAREIWSQETVELLTVGIDIGSSTSHLLFARVVLQQRRVAPTTRFAVVERRVLWRSPILLTPFLPDGTIDAHELRHFIGHCYHDAGFKRGDVDSGAVILTGEAIKRRNARAIDELFAGEAGRFVCATAGHRLESILAAHGSGATALSHRRDACGLHVDIGGGTTKLALIDRGEIVSVAAFAVGGRLLSSDRDGRWTRVDESAALVAAELGIDTAPEALADEEARRRIVQRLAALALDQIAGDPLDALGRRILLTDPLERRVAPSYVTFSGGVSEYIFGTETRSYGDIAQPLAREIVAHLTDRIGVPVVDAGQRIRATVIGASQFTVQVSGKTVYVAGENALPVRNLPVVHLGAPLPARIEPDALAKAFADRIAAQDRDASEPLALAFTWTGLPDYERLLAVARALGKVAAPGGRRRERLLALAIDGDVGQSLGRILDRELGLVSSLVSVDGLTLRDLDFVDFGELMTPPGVVPVVIKSLLFS